MKGVSESLMRLFVALDIDDDIRGSIARFIDEFRDVAAQARWVKPESLHVTLKFIGEQSEDKLETIKRTLETIESGQFAMHFRGYGFFPSAIEPRVFWIGIQADSTLASLAATVDTKLESLNIPKESNPYQPHLTLARGARGSASPRRLKGDRPNRSFQLLQEKLAATVETEFGRMIAREFFLYQSQSAPGGSKYTKLAAFRLREPGEQKI